MEKLLIVDDTAEIRKQLKWGLGKEYKVLLAETVAEALTLFAQHQPKVVTLDLGLPPDLDGATEGLRCLETMLDQQPATKIIVLSGNEDRNNAIMAVTQGAYDFYQKPIELAELKVILRRAFHLADLEADYKNLQAVVRGNEPGLQGIFGECPAMQEIFKTIRKVATADVAEMVLGESGTGKEMVARAIHARVLSKNGPFVPINCGAIPENLLESELFGHEKGAFTGAQTRVLGKVEYAQGGTLFLDEIGEMPASLQVKLLRFLQERIIQRVGGREDIAVDVRILSATNIDIMPAISNGTFREDLYYRLGVISCELPPWRERGEDIRLLANLFLQKYTQECGKKIRGYNNNAVRELRDYAWPGNVRELENKVKRAVVMAETSIVDARDFGFVRTSLEPASVEKEQAAESYFDFSGLTLKQARSRVERELLVNAIEENDGNVARTAELLGVSRPTLYDLMKKHGLHNSAET
ncbi:MAG: PEP-CTERM-box response regulator transcription factor [Geopsychrobacter sp.]|nr:PEP-CTERM-box response regulator transcription factor [Geopsychrobacter sp.]